MSNFSQVISLVTSIGLAISIDIAIFTVSHFKKTNLDKYSWSIPLSITHSVFPALTFFIFWELSQTSSNLLKVFIGLLGFLLTASIVYEILCEALAKEPKFSLPDYLTALLKTQDHVSKQIVRVLAVSWDALFLGPGLLPLMKDNHLSINDMLIVFIIFGLIVFSISQISIRVARKLRAINFSNVNTLAKFNLFGTFCESTIISVIAINLLWSIIFNESNIINSFALSMMFNLLFFLIYIDVLELVSKLEIIQSINE